MSPRSAPSPAWFREHFNEDYRVLYHGRTQEQADAEVAFVVERLAMAPSDRVLDLCCGYGRHLAAFRGHEIDAVGLDLSAALLRQAPRDRGTALVCADMRHLPFADAGATDGFDVVANFFTSFGYFDRDDENAAAAREIARVLRRGGRFLIDLMNPDAVVAALVPRTERTAGPFAVIEERWFDAERRRVEKRIRLRDTRDGTRKEYVESVRVWREDEFRRLLSAAGLEVDDVYGDLSGAPVASDSPRLAYVGTRA